jgi:hypothetical protein
MDLVLTVGQDPNQLVFQQDGRALSITLKASGGLQYPFSVYGSDLELLRKILDAAIEAEKQKPRG